jgi:S1-C subfamily serine protease
MTSLLSLSQDLSALVAQAESFVVAICGDRFNASGIHWQSGLIVTSYESINCDEHLVVKLPDGQTVQATVVGTDPTTDIAVLKLPGETGLTVPNLSNTLPLTVGSLVLALGRAREGNLLASLGIVHTLGEVWRSRSGGRIDQLIRVNLNLGRSGAGGPLLNATGELIGFNTFGPRRQVLTIPVQTMSRVIQQVQEKGHVARGYLGISMQLVPLPGDLQQQLNLANQSGVMILGLDPQAAAAQAGIIMGDMLVAVNDQMIQSPQDLQVLLDPQSVGQTLMLQLIRAGSIQQISVVVGER